MRRIKTNDFNDDFELGLRNVEEENIKGHRKALLVKGEICRKAKAENITGRVANSKGSAKQKAISNRQHERKSFEKQQQHELEREIRTTQQTELGF